jgi:phosphoribosyl-ATP pyrophosphohydrolase
MNRIFGPALDLVREFHRDKGLPPGDDFTSLRTRSQLQTLGERVVEEADELVAALEAGDLAEVFKELADVIYSALGVAVALDLSLDDAYTEVHPVPAVPQDAGPLAAPIAAAQARDLASPTELAETVVHRSRQLRNNLKWRDPKRTGRNLARLLTVSIDLAVAIEMPLNDAFLDIHRNNMTKDEARKNEHGVILKPEKGPDFEKVDLSRLLPEVREQDEE